MPLAVSKIKLIDNSVRYSKVVSSGTVNRGVCVAPSSINAGKYDQADLAGGVVNVTGLTITDADAEGDLLIVTGGKINVGTNTTQGVIYVVGTNGEIFTQDELSVGENLVILGTGDDSGNLDIAILNSNTTVLEAVAPVP